MKIIIPILIVVVIIVAAVILFIKRRKPQHSLSVTVNGQIYVGNLSYRINERDLSRFFEKFGEITHVKVIKHRQTDRSKGFGFVTFASPREANAALVANGEHLKGRKLVVRIAKVK